jgi:hypothetical protein
MVDVPVQSEIPDTIRADATLRAIVEDLETEIGDRFLSSLVKSTWLAPSACDMRSSLR